MPLYDYRCQTHGLFSELATLDSAARPMPCPQCRVPARRAIAVPKAILNPSSARMRAHALNERSQHEPAYSGNSEPGVLCGHDLNRIGSKLLYTQEGNKMFPGMRPWMIGH